MTSEEVVEWLTSIVFGGVAITTAALAHASDGQELTFPQWRAVLFVGEGEDGCRVGEVASLLGSALPASSRLLHRLERRGLMTLEPDERDRRATRARLTPAGKRLRSSVLAYRRGEIAAIVEQVKPAATANRLLRELSERFDERGHARSEYGGPARRHEPRS